MEEGEGEREGEREYVISSVHSFQLDSPTGLDTSSPHPSSASSQTTSSADHKPPSSAGQLFSFPLPPSSSSSQPMDTGVRLYGHT